ncbi:MAG: GAF domain-containing protein [Gammaproteobacteria bacterium]|nr:GAF domain-containing protein [Gammaproteobacteria bacterium]
MPATLSTFGRLVSTIVPRAGGAALFDRQGRVLWAAGGTVPEEMRALVADLLASADTGGPSYTLRCVLKSAASYAFVMRTGDGELAGALAFAIGGPFRRDELLLPGALEQRLAPLLAAGARAVADPVERVLAELAMGARADAAVVCVPRQRLFRCHSAVGSRLPRLGSLRRIASGELAWRAESGGEALRVNRARLDPDDDPFRFISMPLRSGARVFGVLVLFAHASRAGFEPADSELAARSATQLAALLAPDAGGASYFSSRRLINSTDTDTPQVA